MSDICLLLVNKNWKWRKAMKSLLKLMFGVLTGKFKLVEYTRSNSETDEEGKIIMSYGFDVLGSAPVCK